jgi:hypothetical protein
MPRGNVSRVRAAAGDDWGGVDSDNDRRHPWALWKLVGWAFVQQEVLFTDKSLRESFRGSSDLVRGRFWHAARPIVFFSMFTTAAGPVLSFALIFTRCRWSGSTLSGL